MAEVFGISGNWRTVKKGCCRSGLRGVMAGGTVQWLALRNGVQPYSSRDSIIVNQGLRNGVQRNSKLKHQDKTILCTLEIWNVVLFMQNGAIREKEMIYGSPFVRSSWFENVWLEVLNMICMSDFLLEIYWLLLLVEYVGKFVL